MNKFDRGLILSKKYAGEKIFRKVDTNFRGHPCKVQLEVSDNVISFDDEVQHEIQMPVLLKYLYTEESALEWILYNLKISKLDKNTKGNRIGFHLKEMIYSSFFASLGEIVILSCVLEENHGMSLLLFVPETLDFTEKQKSQLQALYPALEETEYVEICYCNDDYFKNRFGTKEEVLSLINMINSKKAK